MRPVYAPVLAVFCSLGQLVKGRSGVGSMTFIYVLCRTTFCFLTLILALSVQSTRVWCQTVPKDSVLTLEGALEIARQRNLSVKNSELEIEKVKDELAAAKSERLPKLEVRASGQHNLVRQRYTFDQGVFGNAITTGPIPAQNTQITSQSGISGHVIASASLPLLQQWRIGVGIDQVKVAEDMARQRLRSDTQEIEKQVKNQYYNILETQSELRAVDESIVYYRSLYDLVHRYVLQQVALDYQQMEVQARLAKSEHAALTLNNHLMTQKEHMNQLLNRDLDMDFEVSPVPGPLPLQIDPKDAVSSAMNQRPDVNEARLKIEHEKLGKQAKTLEYLPHVDLKIHYSKLYNVNLIPDEDAAVGLQAKWEFYNWGRRQDELSKKTKAILQAKNQLQETRSRVAIEVKSRIRGVNEAADQIRVSRLAQVAAREKLRVITNKYRVQATLLQDALRAESELTDANSAYNQSVLALWTAIADLEKSLGSSDGV